MTTTYDGECLECSKCGVKLLVAPPISVDALAAVIEAFDALHDNDHNACPGPVGIVKLMTDRAADLWEAGDAWQCCDDVRWFMDVFAEIVLIQDGACSRKGQGGAP